MTSNRVQLRAAKRSDRQWVAAMLDDYLGELAAHREIAVGATNAASYPYLEAYWFEKGRHALLICLEARVVGFALVRDPVSTGSPAFQMAEFYVAAAHRRQGIGREAALAIWRLFRGPWELQVHAGNAAALKFWSAAIQTAGARAVPVTSIQANDGARVQFNFDLA